MIDRTSKAAHFIMKYFTALIGCFYLLTIGFLFKKNRDVLSEISRHFGYPRVPQKEPLDLPVFHFSKFVSQGVPVKIHEMDYSRGNVSLKELLIINQIIASLRPKKIFELGTFDGRTTLNMAANSPEDAVVYTLDLPMTGVSTTRFDLEEKELVLVEKETSGMRFCERDEAKKIKQFYGDSAQFDYGPYEGQIDFIFIDASHAYEYVLSDSENALKMLSRQNGIILWHDYGAWNGVTRALNELQKRQPYFSKMKHIEGTSLAILM